MIDYGQKTNEARGRSGLLTLFLAFTTVLVGLKATFIQDLSWSWVLAPSWIYALVWIGFIIGAGCVKQDIDHALTLPVDKEK